jgi:glutathione S-transferase
MSLTLHAHPLSQYCQKVLIALYEHQVAFTPHVLDLSKPEVRAAFAQLSPFGKMPALRDDARDCTVLETSIIIEYLDVHYRGGARLIPADPELAWQVRMRDRLFDLYVAESVGKIVTDKFRPAGHHDSHGVEQARATLRTAYQLFDRELADRTWACGETFTLADCAAAPGLFYASKLIPFGDHRHLAGYFQRLSERPSFARATAEAAPYLAMFPA